MNYVISIVTPEALPRLEELTEELALPLNVTLLGYGTAIQSMLDFLGIESNEKRVMLSAATEEKTKAFIEGQRERLHLGVPGHGIVIAVPMKSVGGGKTMEFLKGNETGTGKYTPQLSFAYELIVVIASEGQTELVMDAARAAGARGRRQHHPLLVGLNAQKIQHALDGRAVAVERYVQRQLQLPRQLLQPRQRLRRHNRDHIIHAGSSHSSIISQSP